MPLGISDDRLRQNRPGKISKSRQNMRAGKKRIFNILYKNKIKYDK